MEHGLLWSRDSGTANRLWAGRFGVRIPVGVKILQNVQVGGGLNFNSDLHVVPSLRMNGPVLHFSLYAFMASIGTILFFFFNFCIGMFSSFINFS
jgi:hypothetical protein